MTLAELISGIVEAPQLGALGQERVARVCDDSRNVCPGAVFVALRGTARDGREFIEQARQRGALAIIGEALPGEVGTAAAAPAEHAAMPYEAEAGKLTLITPDARLALARLAARYFGLERQSPRLIGVTGTNGKSTTVFMATSILRSAGKRCGMLGTVQYDLCSRTVTADMTTPGPLELCGYLAECRDSGAEFATLEVSSHALDQKRSDGLRFAAAGFTNLTGDHLDYHRTMEAYAEAKARLFAGLQADAVAVVNADDPAAQRMVRDCRARVVRYGLDSAAEVHARITRETLRGTLYRMHIDGHDLVLENAIVGRHNVYNALCAAALAHGCGVGLEAIEKGLAAVRNIPGRLQRVPCGGFDVFVDYAHTDDALRNVLRVLRPLTRRRLIAVFGCGGDRDRSKRPRMARAAAEFADAIIVTSDNPRTEHPEAIIQEILSGFDESARRRVTVEADRRVAIQVALTCAQPGDCVLIAGKGHENYQIIGREKISFDDVDVAIQAAAALAPVQGAAAK